MEKNYVVTITRDELATVMTALHCEMERDYSDDIKAELFAALLAVADFKVSNG